MHRPALPLLAALALGACASQDGVSSRPSAPSTDARMTDPTRPLGWRQHDIDRPQPERVEPAAPGVAPSDAVVLIGPDGSGLDNWERQGEGGGPASWRTEGGSLVVEPGTGGIQSKEAFGDVQLHVEWRPAVEPEKTSQNRSNSGVFLADGRYEVQVLDVWDNTTYADGRAGAIYGQFPPLVDASLPPDAWQSFDVFFRMPRFEAGGALAEPARMTVLHNGVLVQNNEVLPGTTMWLETLPYQAHGEGRIQLQDHGSAVHFRNLWVRRIAERATAPPDAFEATRVSGADLDRLVGTYTRDNGEGVFVIERTDAGLGLSMPWRPGVLPLVPVSPTSFELQNTGGRIDVDLDGDTPRRLTFRMGGGTYGATYQGPDGP